MPYIEVQFFSDTNFLNFESYLNRIMLNKDILFDRNNLKIRVPIDGFDISEFRQRAETMGGLCTEFF